MRGEGPATESLYQEELRRTAKTCGVRLGCDSGEKPGRCLVFPPVASTETGHLEPQQRANQTNGRSFETKKIFWSGAASITGASNRKVARGLN